MGMHILNRKRQNTMMVFGAVGADDMHIRILLHLFHCQRCQLILTLCDLLKTDSFDITDRFAQRIRACSVDGSRLEFMRHLSIGCTGAGHIFDHFAAGQERRHFFQPLHLAVQRTNSHRSQHLMSGKGQKIHIQLRHINRHMRHTLRAIRYQYDALFVTEAGYAFDIVDTA